MEPNDFWRLCDWLTIPQAALLIVGEDASQVESIDQLGLTQRPPGYEAIKAAIFQAVQQEFISTSIDDPPGTYHPNVSIEIESLRVWLKTRGVRGGFFFPEKTSTPDYLNPEHERYAPKLAAAVHAWLAVTDTQGKSPKQALTKWLREHAVEFGLSNDEGNPNETGIEEVAKVANWQPSGGAPRTPGG